MYTHEPPDIPKLLISANRDWIMLRGRTLAQIEAAAVRSSYLRHKGVQWRVREELGVSRSTIKRKLARLGLRKSKVRHLREIDIARVFRRHRKAIAKELMISDSTLVRWLNKVVPLTPED
jgi:transcriptional regulator with PAS, ATPase and Fis domain